MLKLGQYLQNMKTCLYVISDIFQTIAIERLLSDRFPRRFVVFHDIVFEIVLKIKTITSRAEL